MCRPWYGCDDCASCLYLSLQCDFSRNWTPKTVNGIEKKKKTANFHMFVGLASTLMTLKISKVLSNEARR